MPMPAGLHKWFLKKCPARLLTKKANTWPTLVYTHLLIGSPKIKRTGFGM
jgi:hypothetical protein